MLRYCCVLGRSICKRNLIFICKVNLLNKDKQTIYLINTRRGENLQLVCSLLVQVMNHFEEKTVSAIIPSALNSLEGIAFKKILTSKFWGASEKEDISSLCKNRKSYYLTRDGSVCLMRMAAFYQRQKWVCWPRRLLVPSSYLPRLLRQHMLAALRGENLSIFGTTHCSLNLW